MSSSVSACSITAAVGAEPNTPIGPVVKGESSGSTSFPSSAFAIGAFSTRASCSSSAAAPRAPEPATMAIFLPALRTSAARFKSSGSGTTRGGRQAAEVWPGSFILLGASSSSVCSWKSFGNATCATVRLLSAARTAWFSTVSTCNGPMIRSLNAATSANSRSVATSCW